MTLAGVLSLVLLATLPRLLPGVGGRRRFGAPWLVMLGGLVATYTRGAWIGFAGGVLTVAATVRRGRWLLLAGLVLLAAGALLAPHELRHRFLSMADPEEAGVRERVYMWRSGLAMWRERPVLGIGPGGVKREYSPLRAAGGDQEAHRPRAQHAAADPGRARRAGPGRVARRSGSPSTPDASACCDGYRPKPPRERALVVGSLAAIVGLPASAASPNTTSATPRSSWSPGP